MTKEQNGIAEKKRIFPMEGNCLVNDVIYEFDVTRPLPKKVYGRMENGRAVSITPSYHLNTRDIPIRRHFQVTCGT